MRSLRRSAWLSALFRLCFQLFVHSAIAFPAVGILLVLWVNLRLSASLNLRGWYRQARRYTGDQVMMLVFPSDGSVFAVNEGSVLRQPDASQKDIMLSCVANKE